MVKALHCPTVILAATVPIFAQNIRSIPEIAGQVSKSVVVIEVRDTGDRDFAMGSGFIVRQDGVIVTNRHVIEGASAASVTLSNGDIYDAVLVADADKRKDIAILRIKALNLPVAKLGDSDKLEVGQHVIAIGNPSGLTGSVSYGFVCAVRQLVGFKLIQTTAPISHGSSGGPLLNDAGEVVGITADILEEGQNLNLAVPANYVTPLLQFLGQTPNKTLADFNAGSLKTVAPSDKKTKTQDASPTAVSIDGRWSATFADAKGSGHLDFNLIQNSEGQVVGTYTSSLGGGGRIKGSLSDTQLAFELTQSIENCPGVFKARGIRNESKINGSYTGTDCLGDHGSGNFTMTRSNVAEGAKEASVQKLPHELKRDSGVFLEKQLKVWTPENARLILGEPVRHRYSYDDFKNINGDINAYPDPTRMYREFELVFDKQTNVLASVYIYPWNLTWNQCKQVWGDNVKSTKNADGSRFYVYRNKHLNVYASNDGKIISLGLY